MRIDGIFPVVDEKATCLECAIKSALSKWRIDTEYLYIGALNFGYNDKMRLFGERISCNKRQMFKYIEYQGVGISRKKAESYNELFTIICNELNHEKPIVVYINTYYCPWNEIYNQYEFNHYCTIIGYDNEKEVFYCIDSYLTDKIVELNYKDLKLGYKDYITFEEKEKKIISKVEILSDIIEGALEKQGGLTMIDRIKKFGDDLVHQIPILYEEIDMYNNAKYANVLVELAFLSWAREKINKIIGEWIKEPDIEEKLIRDIDLWEQLRSVVYRQILIREKNYSEEIRGKIEEIANSEEYIIKELQKYLHKT